MKFRVLSDKDKKIIEYLKLIVPIYIRLKEEGDELDIDNVLHETVKNIGIEKEFPDIPYTGVPIVNYNQPPNYNFSSYYTPPDNSHPIIRMPIDNDSDGYKVEEESTTEDDQEDTKVASLTEKTLKLLSDIQKNNWSNVEAISEITVTDNDECPQLVKGSF